MSNATKIELTLAGQMSGDSTNDMACEGSLDCFDADPLGVLSTSDSNYQPAYMSQTGWDFTSGVGTPNVINLINAWPYP